jgi:hypothetical protein
VLAQPTSSPLPYSSSRNPVNQAGRAHPTGPVSLPLLPPSTKPPPATTQTLVCRSARSPPLSSLKWMPPLPLPLLSSLPPSFEAKTSRVMAPLGHHHRHTIWPPPHPLAPTKGSPSRPSPHRTPHRPPYLLSHTGACPHHLPLTPPPFTIARPTHPRPASSERPNGSPMLHSPPPPLGRWPRAPEEP